MTEAEAAYFAGFFDGEGCIAISDSKSTCGKPNHALRVLLSNTCKEVMELWAKATGGILKHRANPNGHSADIWSVVLSSHDAQRVLKQLLPYLKVKREQADVGIAFQDLLDTRGGKGKPLTEEDINPRECFKQLLIDLREQDKKYSFPRLEGVRKQGFVTLAA